LVNSFKYLKILNSKSRRTGTTSDTPTSKDIKPISSPIKAKTYTGMYAMHKYWAKKAYNVINTFIENFTDKGDIVLDPFAGCGVTACEALKLKRKAIAIDLNPIATFITRMTAIPVNLLEFKKTFEKISHAVKDKINSLYVTECPKCNTKAIITHTIWKGPSPQKIRFWCPYCKADSWKAPAHIDIEKIKEIEKIEVPHWYPKQTLIWNTRVNVDESMSVPDLFSKRNLIALSILYNEIQKIPEEQKDIKNLMKFVFTSALPQTSKMVFVIKRRGKVEGKRKNKQPEVGSWVAGYWIPSEHFEINVWRCFLNRYKRVLKGKKESNEGIGYHYKEAENFDDLLRNSSIYILTQSATNLHNIPDESVDYVFTDPPHGDRLPYLELSIMWNSWLGFNSDFDNEIVISNSPLRKKTIEDYRNRMYKAFMEIYRVLKPNKYMSVTFNSRHAEVLYALLTPCAEAGFELVNVLPLQASAPSVMQDTRLGALRGDLIITFWKPIVRRSYDRLSKNDFEILVKKTVEEVMSKRGITMNQILREIIMVLLENRVLLSKEETFKILRKYFVIEEENGRLKRIERR